MAKKRTHSAPLALTLDGSVLLNRSAHVDPATLSELAEALAVDPADLFLGTRLNAPDRLQALMRLDNAAAEAAARIQSRPTVVPAANRRKRTAAR